MAWMGLLYIFFDIFQEGAARCGLPSTTRRRVPGENGGRDIG